MPPKIFSTPSEARFSPQSHLHSRKTSPTITYPTCAPPFAPPRPFRCCRVHVPGEASRGDRGSVWEKSELDVVTGPLCSDLDGTRDACRGWRDGRGGWRAGRGEVGLGVNEGFYKATAVVFGGSSRARRRRRSRGEVDVGRQETKADRRLLLPAHLVPGPVPCSPVCGPLPLRPSPPQSPTAPPSTGPSLRLRLSHVRPPTLASGQHEIGRASCRERVS